MKGDCFSPQKQHGGHPHLSRCWFCCNWQQHCHVRCHVPPSATCSGLCAAHPPHILLGALYRNLVCATRTLMTRHQSTGHDVQAVHTVAADGKCCTGCSRHKNNRRRVLQCSVRYPLLESVNAFHSCLHTLYSEPCHVYPQLLMCMMLTSAC